MFERFTDRARRVVVLAQAEARTLNHDYIGTEHLLLALIHEGEGVAAKALESVGVERSEIRREVRELIGEGSSAPTGPIPFTPRAKKVLELSLREALQLGHNYIGTEHILLGLVREGEGVGAQVLRKQGVTMEVVQTEVASLLAGHTEEPAPAEATPHDEPCCPRCRGRLRDTAAYRVLDVAPVGEGEPRALTFAFCRVCGTWLGTLP